MIVFNYLYLFTMPPCWQILWILNALIHVLPINSLYKLKKKKKSCITYLFKNGIYLMFDGSLII